MNSPHNLPHQLVVSTEGDTQARVEDYLDYLCAPLLGIVPYAQRRRLRAETADHLLNLMEDFGMEGFSPSNAVTAALREYGEPWVLGQSFADAWLSGASPTRVTRLADAATLRAFGWFGIFTVLNLLLLEWSLLGQAGDWLLPLTQCLTLLSPILAGIMAGVALDSRTNTGICRAIPLLALVSAAVGLLLRPQMEGLRFAVFQLVFWLPIGCLAATIATSLRRQFLLRGFQRTTH